MIILSHLILSYSFSSCVFPRPTFLHFCLFVLSFCATSSRYSVTCRHRGPRKRLGRVSPRVTGEERTRGETINLTLRLKLVQVQVFELARRPEELISLGDGRRARAFIKLSIFNREPDAQLTVQTQGQALVWSRVVWAGRNELQCRLWTQLSVFLFWIKKKKNEVLVSLKSDDEDHGHNIELIWKGNESVVCCMVRVVCLACQSVHT